MNEHDIPQRYSRGARGWSRVTACSKIGGSPGNCSRSYSGWQCRERKQEGRGRQLRGGSTGRGGGLADGRARARADEDVLEAWVPAAHRCEGVGEVSNVGRGVMLR